MFLRLSSVFLFVFYLTEVKKVLKQDINSWTEDHHGDCAVVLTGSRGRVKEGLSLLARKSIKKLIVSGVYPQAEIRDIFPEWPYYGDLNSRDVVLEKYSKTTYGNALQTRTLVEVFECKSLILITTRLHMFRAYNTFKGVFPKDFPIVKRAVIGNSFQLPIYRVLIEALKSLFYSTWAY